MIGCSADCVSLHVLHIRPVSGCAPGSCGTLSMSPRGSCQLQHFLKLHEHLKADRDSICAHFCETVIPYQGVTGKEGSRAWSLKVPLGTAGSSLGVALPNSPVQMFSGGPDAQENLLGLCCSHHKSVSRLWAELWARFAC